VTKTVNALIAVADGKEDIVAAYERNQFGLLLVDVLEFIQHDLADLGSNARLHVGARAQQGYRPSLEVVEVKRAECLLARGIEIIEPGEDVEDESAVQSGREVYSGCDQVLQRLF